MTILRAPSAVTIQRLHAALGRRRPFLICVALSMVLHAVLLLSMQDKSAAQPRLAGLPAATTRTTTISFRMAIPVANPSAAAEAADVTTLNEAPSIPERATKEISSLQTPLENANPPGETRQGRTEETETTPKAEAPPLAPSTPVATASAAPVDPQGYLPRSMLSVVPEAQTPVVIRTPPGYSGSPRDAVIFALFIDEEGTVQFIDAEPSSIPADMEQSARATFMATRFSPGQKDGRAVKSRVRIEVVFEVVAAEPTLTLPN